SELVHDGDERQDVREYRDEPGDEDRAIAAKALAGEVWLQPAVGKAGDTPGDNERDRRPKQGGSDQEELVTDFGNNFQNRTHQSGLFRCSVRSSVRTHQS